MTCYLCVIQHREEGNACRKKVKHRKKIYKDSFFRFCEFSLTPPSSWAFPLLTAYCICIGVASALGSYLTGEIWEHHPVSLISSPNFKANAQEVCPYMYHWDDTEAESISVYFPAEPIRRIWCSSTEKFKLCLWQFWEVGCLLLCWALHFNWYTNAFCWLSNVKLISHKIE